MKLIILSLFCCSLAYGQFSAGYYHDPTLDTINSSEAVFNSDFDRNVPGLLTISNTQAQALLNNGTVSLLHSNTILYDLPTNVFVVSNAWTAVTGGLQFTNNFSSISSATNGTPNSLSVISLNDNNGHSFTMDLSSAVLTSSTKTMLGLFRQIIMAFVYIFLFAYCFQFVQGDFMKAMNQRQAQGNLQEVFGTNASIATGLIYAGLIVAGLTALLGFIVSNGICKTSIQQALTLLPLLQSLSTVPGWDVMTYVFPITDILTAYFTYLSFRYILCFPLFVGVRSIQLFMVQ